MGENTGIQWTDHTYNPWQGCQKVSPGCDNCYMFRDKKRYGQDPEKVVRSKPPTFNKPRRWNAEAKAAGTRRLVFTASWADFFSREADEWRPEAWALIKECGALTFQILTKRHARIADHLPADWGAGYPNVWLGVSGENQEWADRRWASLDAVPALTKFISYEPAIGPLTMALWPRVPDWLIIGGESGPNEREFDLAWAQALIVECGDRGVAAFVKQAGSSPVRRVLGPCDIPACNCGRQHMSGALPVKFADSHGGDMSEWPEWMRVREFPALPTVTP